MEKNTKLQAVEALDISVLLKRMSKAEAFELVINLIKTSYDVKISIQDYWDYLWGEYANDEPWEKEINKHSPHRMAIDALQKKLLSFVMQEVWAHKEMTDLAKEHYPIDIKSLVYEMNDDKGVELLNNLIEKVNSEIDYLEWLDIHGEGFSKEIHSDYYVLTNLRDQMQAIIKEQAILDERWKYGVEQIEKERAKENSEMIECLNHRESELEVSISGNNKENEVVASVSIADM